MSPARSAAPARSARARAASTSRPARPRAHRRRHRAHRHVRLGPGPAAPGRRPDRPGHRHRPPSLRPGRARLDEDGVPAGRRPRPGGAAGGVRRRRRRRPPGVPDHRQRLARDDPGDQRRRHAQRVPRRGRRRGPPVRLRLLRRGLRLPRRQPGRGSTRTGRPGRRRGCSTRRRRPSWRTCSRRRPRRTPSWRCSCCARRSSWVPTSSAARTSCPGRWPRSGRKLFGRPRRLPVPVPVFVPELPDAVHPRGGRRPRAACSASSAAGPARRLQHRRRRHRHRGRRRPRVRRRCRSRCRPGPRRRRPGRSPGCRSCRRSPSGSRRPAGR